MTFHICYGNCQHFFQEHSVRNVAEISFCGGLSDERKVASVWFGLFSWSKEIHIFLSLLLGKLWVTLSGYNATEGNGSFL